MKSFIKRIFIDNWQRKLVSIILAMVIWIVVNHSITISRTFHNIPIKIINIPAGKTIEGLRSNGLLDKTISLTLTGKRNAIDALHSSDLEILLDAENREDEWSININKNNLISFNPNVDISQSIGIITHPEFLIKFSKLVTDRIPIIITKPIGKAPQGYKFIDIWPYQLYITLSGAEESIKKLKTKGLQLTFNLNNISENELNALTSLKKTKDNDEISFFVPSSWKRINVPLIATTPLTIDDPKAKHLRVDFVRQNLIPIKPSIPVSIYYPLKYSSEINPTNSSLEESSFIENKNGIFLITTLLYARGASGLFLDIVQDMIQIVVTISPNKNKLLWNTQFIYPQELEDRYVSKILSETPESDLATNVNSQLHEEYIRNRFRSYINHFRLYLGKEKLRLKIFVKDNKIIIEPKK